MGQPGAAFRAVCYSRVSTSQQLDSKDSVTIKRSLQEQVEQARRVAEERGWAFVEAFIEPGISADDFEERREIQRLLKAARAGEFNLVITRDSKRLARAQHIYHYIIHTLLTECRVQIYDLDDPEPPEPPHLFNPRSSNRLVYKHGIKGMLAEADQNDRTRRLQAGIEANIRAGRFLSASPPYGYRLELQIKQDAARPGRSSVAGLVDRVPVPDASEYPTLLFILKLALSGHSDADITRTLNQQGIPARNGGPWHRGPMAKLLTNRFYCGFVTYGRRRRTPTDKHKTTGHHGQDTIYAPHTFERPLTVAQYEAVQAGRTERNTMPSRSRRSRNPLGDLLRCGYCNARMKLVIWTRPGKTRTNRLSYMLCTGHETGLTDCPPRRIATPVVMAALKEALLRTAARARKNPAGYYRKILNTDGVTGQVEALRRRETELERLTATELPRKLSVLRARLLDETVTGPEYRLMRDDLEGQLQGALAALTGIRAQLDSLRVTERHVRAMNDFFSWFERHLAGYLEVPLAEWPEERTIEARHQLGRVISRMSVKGGHNSEQRKWECELELEFKLPETGAK